MRHRPRFLPVPFPRVKGPDWRMTEPKPLSPGLARVSVKMTELCLKVKNNLGLYETKTGNYSKGRAWAQSPQIMRGYLKLPFYVLDRDHIQLD